MWPGRRSDPSWCSVAAGRPSAPSSRSSRPSTPSGSPQRRRPRACSTKQLSTLPGAQAQVSAQNRAAFAELRTDLEQVNAQALDLLAAPQDISAAALQPLQEQLAALQASVQQRAAELTGISVEEQQAWADLAQSVQATADQVGFLAGLLG